ncbi:MAG: hypothetical protein RL557_474 [archaeon]
MYGVVSRLGTRNNPNGTHEANEGVAHAYESILDLEFMTRLMKEGEPLIVHSYYFSDPSIVTDEAYFPTITKESKGLIKYINGTIGPGEIQCAIGGDHSISYATLGAWLERMKNPDKALVIHWDSHCDSALNSQSPSKNFHGMWMRPFVDKFDIPCLDNVTKLKGPQWCYIGDLEKEPGFEPWEMDFIKQKGINYISKQDIVSGKAKPKLQNLLGEAKQVYTTFDIDVFTQSVAPATGITGNWGLTRGEVFPLLEQIATSKKLSGLDLVEVNPEKEGAAKTIQTAQEVLETLLLHNDN